MDTLMAYKATVDPDTMYLHEYMNQSNSNEFKKAIKKERDGQMKNENSASYPYCKFQRELQFYPKVGKWIGKDKYVQGKKKCTAPSKYMWVQDETWTPFWPNLLSSRQLELKPHLYSYDWPKCLVHQANWLCSCLNTVSIINRNQHAHTKISQSSGCRKKRTMF